MGGEGPPKEKGKSAASRGETSSSAFPPAGPPAVVPVKLGSDGGPISRLTFPTFFLPAPAPPFPGIDATSVRMSYTMPPSASPTRPAATGESSSPSDPAKRRDLCPFLAVRAGPGPVRGSAADAAAPWWAGGEDGPKEAGSA